ncbi:hypothetical protein ABWH93_17775 [Seohaeicola saemankumensis]|uniref:hypothetical protein n=1 Tax=Seohaeicola TaxID=481178 RepID=UPI0010FF0946|nr:hypothetical protein [Paracoccaceae bacterium]
MRAPFQKIRADRDKIIGQNVVGGAIAGALLVAALGGNAEDAMKGALVGGLAGAARAYAENAKSRGATENSLAKFANADARREAAQNDELVSTLLRMNACRLDQVEAIGVRARKGEISRGEAQSLLDQVRRATLQDNRVVNSVAGNRRTYDAYVGVLNANDVAAANRTRESVATYKPDVSKVTRTSRGQAAISTGGRASGATDVALARNSAVRLDAVSDAHVESVEALIGNLDLTTPT